MSLQQVHLRVNDAVTGKPTPVRLRITDADGVYYAPYGRLTEFATGVNQDVGGNVMIGAKKWAYTDGACEILLPPGKLHIEIAKGFEYKPIDEEITLLAGKMSLRFTIERWCDLRKEGWYSGDMRVHFLSPDGALLEGQAEDVAVVNLLAKETTVIDSFGKSRKSIPNLLSFSGQSFARQADGCGVAVNTHNVHPQLGSLGLLHCHRVVYPLRVDSETWTLDDWCGQCHRKKGLVVWTDPLHETGDFRYGEPLADTILGNVDAFELTFFEDSPFDALPDYYQLCQAGITIPLVGASGKESNGIALGSMRTYAYMPPDQEFTYTGWIDAVRSGRSFVTNGPLLQLTINGGQPSTEPIVSDGAKVQVRAHAKSLNPFSRLELIWNGAVVMTANCVTSKGYEALLETETPVGESGWLAVRCIGQTLVPSRPSPQRIFAHSSAIVVRRHDQSLPVRGDAVQALKTEVDNLFTWAVGQKLERVGHVVEQARTVLAKKMSPT